MNLRKMVFLLLAYLGWSIIYLKFSRKRPLVVIVGSEDKGISLLTQKKCDFLLSILLNYESSLNASMAAAISLFLY